MPQNTPIKVFEQQKRKRKTKLAHEFHVCMLEVRKSGFSSPVTVQSDFRQLPESRFQISCKRDGDQSSQNVRRGRGGVFFESTTRVSPRNGDFRDNPILISLSHPS